MRNDFARIASDDEWRLVGPAFGLMDVVNTIALKEITNGSSTAEPSSVDQDAKVAFTPHHIPWIRAIGEQVAEAVTSLGGSPDRDAARKVAAYIQKNEADMATARDELRRTGLALYQTLEEQGVDQFRQTEILDTLLRLAGFDTSQRVEEIHSIMGNGTTPRSSVDGP